MSDSSTVDEPPPNLLDDPTRLRNALVAELHAALGAARIAVHSMAASRDALTRLRAITALITNSLKKRDRRALTQSLQSAQHETAIERDRSVVRVVGQLGLDPDATAAALAAIAPDDTRPDLRAIAHRATAAVDAVVGTLPATISLTDVVEVIRDTYENARDARRAAKRRKKPLRKWQRRARELAAQLDFIASHAGPRVARIRAELNAGNDHALDAIELVVARDYFSGLDNEVSGVERAIAERLSVCAADARHASRDAYHRTSSKFAKRLRKAIRKDLAVVPAPVSEPATEP